MLDEVKKIGVIFRRDFRVYFTYKLAVSMAFLSILFNFLYMVLFGSMFKAGVIPALESYGGNFISYILVGTIGWGFMWAVMSGTSESLRTEMTNGTIESLLLTPTSIYTIIVAYTLFSAFFGFLSIIGLLIIGFVFFGLNILSTISIFTILIFILSIILMTGIGMILAGLTIWIKNIGQTAPFIQSITMFFCGIYFPIAVLPESLQVVAKFIPFYYFIEGLRLSLIPKTPINILINYTFILIGFSLFFLIFGAYAMHKGMIKAKREGSLSFY